MRLINKIILHCSATKDTGTQSFDAIKFNHINTLGWEDIGYHFVLEYVKGDIITHTGRPIETVGSHCLGQNTHSIGICVVGDFDKTEPTEAMYHELSCLIWDLMNEYDLDMTDIYPHYRFSTEKTCPGRKFNMIKVIKHLLED